MEAGDAAVKIDGWSNIPEGYGLTWDLSKAPLWLRVWFRIPILDRFAYPKLIRRQFAWLVPHPDWPEAEREPVPPGWLVWQPPAENAPPRWKNYSRE